MSSREFAEWMAFARIEPFGEEARELRLARLLAFLANIVHALTRRRRGGKVFEPRDFLPNFWDAVEIEPEPEAPPARQDWQQQLQYMELWNAAMGGKDLRPS
jgi:hypothetical protein